MYDRFGAHIPKQEELAGPSQKNMDMAKWKVWGSDMIRGWGRRGR